jgi:hypothetical protein
MRTTLCQIGGPLGAELFGPGGTRLQRIAFSDSVQFTKGLLQPPSE